MGDLLIYGYGNPGRQDDGLGTVLAEKINSWAGIHIPGQVDVETNYQLNIEDAEKISHYKTVIFVDASQESLKDFAFTPISPSNATVEFTMHAVAPEYVVYLCNDLFQKKPNSFLLHIRGFNWGMKEGLSGKAHKNLEKSFQFLKSRLKNSLLIIQNQ